MAYQRAYPRPFAPPGFQPQEVQHGELTARAVMRNIQSAHEDFTIVSISPLPNNVLHFPVVVEVVQEFLEEHMHIRVRDIQPSHFGQALVRFVNVHDRDLLVINIPHPYSGVDFGFVRHNQGQCSC
jgi:hypothetical protein